MAPPPTIKEPSDLPPLPPGDLIEADFEEGHRLIGRGEYLNLRLTFP